MREATVKTVCSYAACTTAAVTVEDSWPLCGYHRREHRLIKTGQELPDLPEHRLTLPRWVFQQPHGTLAAARQHHRNGTRLCPPCIHAAKIDSQDKYQQAAS
jgi:hypothetical protein